jgi:hypothetical protein
MAKAKSRSTSLPEDLDLRVRTIALRENRTPANVLENAVRVFTLIPQDLRNLLIENSADQTKGARKIEELRGQARRAHETAPRAGKRRAAGASGAAGTGRFENLPASPPSPHGMRCYPPPRGDTLPGIATRESA